MSSPAATPQAAAFVVNDNPSDLTTDDKASDVAYRPDGKFFVVTWQSYTRDAAGRWDVYFRYYSPAAGTAHLVTTTDPSAQGECQYDAAVAMNADGNTVIAYTSGLGVWARRTGSSGTFNGDEIHLDGLQYRVQSNVDLAVVTDGSFLAVWQSEAEGESNPPDGFGIVRRRFDASGAASFADAVCDPDPAGDQYAPRVGVTGTGEFIVTWQSRGTDDHWHIFRRRFDAAGVAISGSAGDKYQVDYEPTTGDADQVLPAIAVAADGRFLIVWSNLGPTRSADGVRGVRFTAASAAVDNPALVVH